MEVILGGRVSYGKLIGGGLPWASSSKGELLWRAGENTYRRKVHCIVT